MGHGFLLAAGRCFKRSFTCFHKKAAFLPASKSHHRLYTSYLAMTMGQLLCDIVLSCCQAITKYVTSRGFALDSHEIVTNFPRRILTDMDETKTLKDLGLFPQETVFVQKR